MMAGPYRHPYFIRTAASRSAQIVHRLLIVLTSKHMEILPFTATHNIPSCTGTCGMCLVSKSLDNLESASQFGS